MIHKSNLSRGHYVEHFCDIIVNLNYTSTTTSKAWPSIYSMHLPLQSRLKAFGGSIGWGVV